MSGLTVGDVRALLARAGIPHADSTHYAIVAAWPDGAQMQACCDDLADSARLLNMGLAALGQEVVAVGASPFVVVNREDLRAALARAERADARDRLCAAAGIPVPVVHYLTRNVTVACQSRPDLVGAPLNSTVRADVTCEACKASDAWRSA